MHGSAERSQQVTAGPTRPTRLRRAWPIQGFGYRESDRRTGPENRARSEPHTVQVYGNCLRNAACRALSVQSLVVILGPALERRRSGCYCMRLVGRRPHLRSLFTHTIFRRSAFLRMLEGAYGWSREIEPALWQIYRRCQADGAPLNRFSTPRGEWKWPEERSR